MSDADTYSPQNPQPSPPRSGGGGGPMLSPDPTTLTTEALTRQIQNLKELMNAKIDGTVEVTKVQLDGIREQFEVVEAWRKEQKLDTKIAVDAAMAAAEKARQDASLSSEKAIAKSEAASTEQSKQQFATFSETTKALDTKFNDLKERVLRIESTGFGAREANAESRDKKNDNQAFIFALLGIGIAIVSFSVPLIIVLATRK